MPEQAWSKIGILCPDCKQQVQLNEAVCSADSEFQFAGKCPKCKERVVWRVFAAVLAHQALCNDLVREQHAKTNTKPCVQAPQQPLTPPLALPAPPPKLTAQDIRQLRSWAITPPEDGLLQ